MTYTEFSALTEAVRHVDVELTYKNRFTDFEFTIKATQAINGDEWLFVITTDCDTSVRDLLKSFGIVFYYPAPGKFLFVH